MSNEVKLEQYTLPVKCNKCGHECDALKVRKFWSNEAMETVQPCPKCHAWFSLQLIEEGNKWFMGKHTKGPWTAKGCSVVLNQRDQEFECRFQYIDKDKIEQDLADAKLIAASPELYELLDKCRAEISQAPYTLTGSQLLERIDELFKKIEGA